MTKLFENEILLLIVGITTLIFAIFDYRKNYSKSGAYGKASKIGLILLGITFIMLSLIQFSNS
ncbi:hypothetical protein BXY80_0367 [Ichthyenterobacterium magnum]|uniref:Uncharacterized protein n=1 Tax=Ichthyenterobacterium magnum TaxID=1230530 RepID=A0A420DVN4_9FLAO|nr:hypothetical protein BXY80_0367 [Ichthyenterobacterium magnum]